MDKLLIAKTGVAYAGTRSAPTVAEGAVTPDLLAAGAFGIYGFHRNTDGNERFSLITHTASTTFATPGAYKAKDTDYTGGKIKFFLGANSANLQAVASVSQPRQSSEIQLRGIRRLYGTPYKAYALEVSTITPPALPTTTTAYDSYLLHVTETPVTKEVKSWTFQVVGVFANLAAMIDAMVLKINNRANIPFTASRSSNTLLITAKYPTKVYSFGFDDYLYGSTVVKSTPMDLGSGNLYQIAKKEKNYNGEQGWFDQIDRRMPGIDQLALEDNYIVYNVEFVNTFDAAHEQNGTNTDVESMVIAIPQGTAQAQVLENIFNVFAAAGKLGTVPTFNNAAQYVNGTTTTTT